MSNWEPSSTHFVSFLAIVRLVTLCGFIAKLSARSTLLYGRSLGEVPFVCNPFHNIHRAASEQEFHLHESPLLSWANHGVGS
eukprot:scaffold504420_cov83-Attheya_sp.AAC.1